MGVFAQRFWNVEIAFAAEWIHATHQILHGDLDLKIGLIARGKRAQLHLGGCYAVDSCEVRLSSRPVLRWPSESVHHCSHRLRDDFYHIFGLIVIGVVAGGGILTHPVPPCEVLAKLLADELRCTIRDEIADF